MNLPTKHLFIYKLLTVVVLSAIIDVVAALHIKTLVENKIVIATLTIVATHYLGFFGSLWFIEEKQFVKRLLLTTACAIGAGLGTIMVILWA